MANLAFFAAFVLLPIGSFLLVRSLTWVVAAVTGALALAGALVTYLVDHDVRWTLAQLQWLTLVALLLALVASFVVRRRRDPSLAVPLRRQLSAVIAPVVVGMLVLLVSRLAAAPRAGMFTAVGFLVQRQHAEDNAKWLDFAAQLITGNPIHQGVPMGGPLQLFMVIIATGLAAVSFLAFGGVNEVLVASNTVVYAEYILAAMVPFALAPIAELRLRAGPDGTRPFIPASLVWTGMLTLIVGSLAVSGLGHLTLQFVFIAVAFWVAVFLAGSREPHVYALASVGAVAVSLVWFPLTPISLLVLIGGAIVLGYRVITVRPWRGAPLVPAVLWLVLLVLTWSTLAKSIRYMTDTTAASASPALGGGGGGGGVRASVGAFVTKSLDLLTSQGGTEAIAPAAGVLVVLSAVLGMMYLKTRRAGQSKWRLAVAFGPAALIGLYGISLSVAGTWWAGAGPAYGAVKTTFMASMVILAVTVPFALMELDRRKAGLTLVRIAAIGGIIYLLTIDTIMPRAFQYLSPQQWPTATGENRGYWWPAEVKSQANQPISSNPIACGYYPQGAKVPSALPNGQTAYSCTRILVGLAGADTTGQALVDWQRREWLTNTPAWLEEYPGLSSMPESVRQQKFILLNILDGVVGLESVQTFLDREKPDWAKTGTAPS